MCLAPESKPPFLDVLATVEHKQGHRALLNRAALNQVFGPYSSALPVKVPRARSWLGSGKAILTLKIEQVACRAMTAAGLAACYLCFICVSGAVTFGAGQASNGKAWPLAVSCSISFKRHGRLLSVSP